MKTEDYLSHLTKTQKSKFGKKLAKALEITEELRKLEVQIGKAIASDVIRMEKRKDVNGLIKLAKALDGLFICRFVHEAIFRIK